VSVLVKLSPNLYSAVAFAMFDTAANFSIGPRHDVVFSARLRNRQAGDHRGSRAGLGMRIGIMGALAR